MFGKAIEMMRECFWVWMGEPDNQREMFRVALGSMIEG